ncbi:hypothetical protein GL218_05441 [Daldinia childiae]|uniref:uncharacterized protein n=1 Tax=Daldinia childiae TaxID=326645 RepID=UPI001444AF1D|nr:uncharacterized protein GL218_05441 [Daldinia childiae]KAF3058559.1 hypothetical protein GL218_05441 [Daldinia childiae]
MIKPPAAYLERTVILSPSIHCPTCTSFIEKVLLGLNTKIRLVETSIVNHSVTIQHESNLDIDQVADALMNAGYKVESITSEPHLKDGDGEVSSHRSRGSPDDDFPVPWLGRAVQTWRRRSRVTTTNSETTKQLHAEHCKSCADEMLNLTLSEKNELISSTTSNTPSRTPFVAIDYSEPGRCTRPYFSASAAS